MPTIRSREHSPSLHSMSFVMTAHRPRRNRNRKPSNEPNVRQDYPMPTNPTPIPDGMEPCTDCGKPIPESNGFCVACRYHDQPKAPAWDSASAGPLAGSQVSGSDDGFGPRMNGKPL